MKHSCQKTWESTVGNGQQAKRSQRSSFSFKKTANDKTSWCTLMAQSPRTSQGGASLFKQGATTIHKNSAANLQLDNGSRSSHHALRWIASRGDSQTVQSIILTDSMSVLQKVKSGMGSPEVACFWEDLKC